MQSILATKLYIPISRTKPIFRQRLHDKLQTGMSGRLTLVTAPAGSGKSTLVSEWIQQQTHPVAWLSLDEADSDPVRFLLHLIAALQTIDENIGHEIREYLNARTTPALETLFESLINDLLNSSDTLILVLDDYHAVESIDIDRAFAYFIQHSPAHLHIVMISRAEPAFPLSRLRVRDELTEIRAADLRFSGDEIQHFFEHNTEISLSHDNASAIEKRTEGWAAGLQLAALALKRTPHIDDFVQTFTGSHRYVMDYLTDEVLEGLGEDEKRFLLETSILDAMCAELCQAVTGREDTQSLLEHFETMNLFVIPLDDERRWYRYHHLFASLLQHRLMAYSQDERNRLHRQAGDWYASQTVVDTAIQHYQRASHKAGIIALIKTHASRTIREGYIGQVGRWFDSLPEDVLKSDYFLARTKAWMAYFAQQPAQAGLWLDAAMNALNAQRDTLDEDPAQAEGSILTLKAWAAGETGDPNATIQIGQQALATLPEHALSERGMTCIFMGDTLLKLNQFDAAISMYEASLPYNEACENWIAVTGAIGSIARLQTSAGHLQAALVHLDRVIDSVTKHGQARSTTSTRITRLVIWYLRNQLDDMQQELTDLYEMMQFEGTKSTAPYQLAAARYFAARGEHDKARQALKLMEEQISDWHTPHYKQRILARGLLVYLSMGDMERPFAWYQTQQLDVNQLNLSQFDEYFALLEILRHINTPQSRQEAFVLIEALLQMCDESG